MGFALGCAVFYVLGCLVGVMGATMWLTRLDERQAAKEAEAEGEDIDLSDDSE